MMDDVYEELRSLKRRVEELENESQIRAVLNSYGPAVDSNDPEKTSRIYAEDCTVDIDGAWSRMAIDSARQALRDWRDSLSPDHDEVDPDPVTPPPTV